LITGIGLDMVHIQRMERWMQNPGLLQRFFHPGELAAVLERKSNATASLAARFAAKEAFGKALGTGLAEIVLKDIMVVSGQKGRPEIQAFGSALVALKKNGANRVHLSLTHEHDNATAIVVLEST